MAVPACGRRSSAASAASAVLAAGRNNVPAVYTLSDFARDGGLLSYGVDPVDLFRRAASYVDRILHGERSVATSRCSFR
jgi:putative ABC transport system substrate-binding protein